MRIPFDSLTLRAVTDELRAALVGGVVQRVSQPGPLDVVLDVRLPAATRHLLLSCDAVRARVHLIGKRPASPATPPPFCMLCRKYLAGAAVIGVEQRGFDRVLDIRLSGADGETFTLTAEVMGKHSNVVLVGPDGAVLDAAKRITHRLSRHRVVLPGAPYVAPPAQASRDDPFVATRHDLDALAAVTGSDARALAEALQSRFAGVSPLLAQELAARASADSLSGAWSCVFLGAAQGHWEPVIVRSPDGQPAGAYPIPLTPVPPARQERVRSISHALDQSVTAGAQSDALDAARKELTGDIRRALRSLTTHREALQHAVEEAGRADELRQTGELLLAQSYAITEGAASATITDYYAPGAPQRTVALDSRKSVQENAEAWFRRYRKARAGAESVGARIATVDAQLAALRAAEAEAAAAAEAAPIDDLRARLQEMGALRSPAAEAPATGPARMPDLAGKPIRTMHTPEGWQVLFGENAEANDYLTRRVAAPNDLWLHVRANTSAHVVVRTNNHPDDVPPSVLRLAASVAARHSAAKHSSLVPVDVTLAKFVRRPKGAAPGTVVYRNERTLNVAPAEEA